MSNKHELIEDLSQALARLGEASERMRQRLDQVDPYEQPSRWSAINDQIRGLDERISVLRDEHQRVSLVVVELLPLSRTELEALRQATTALSGIVRAMGTSAAVAEAAGKLAVVASDLVKKSLPKG
ncbi:hypothetical protein [Nannocystis pusilla]|uniref:Uncharacterized protein n=1 Tax=Nannocystis pusilla TaxID=889268 RepID=A0ABS7TP32_9BACT|nr:hypothetical protein [Nannocystis pusilla]MBZ5709831.1 hypothetical protein [Nannocystis pusilla]